MVPYKWRATGLRAEVSAASHLHQVCWKTWSKKLLPEDRRQVERRPWCSTATTRSRRQSPHMMMRGPGLPLLRPVSPAPTVVAVTARPVRRLGTVLTGSDGASLYLLSSASGDPVHCDGACLSIWPPVVVPSSVRRVRAGRDVAGHLGLVPRSSATEQVTDNGYPLYTFAGDSRPGQTKGQGVVSFGGTWHLVRAGARTPAGTAVR